MDMLLFPRMPRRRRRKRVKLITTKLRARHPQLQLMTAVTKISLLIKLISRRKANRQLTLPQTDLT